jgi:hypothetical protein
MAVRELNEILLGLDPGRRTAADSAQKIVPGFVIVRKCAERFGRARAAARSGVVDFDGFDDGLQGLFDHVGALVADDDVAVALVAVALHRAHLW